MPNIPKIRSDMYALLNRPLNIFRIELPCRTARTEERLENVYIC